MNLPINTLLQGGKYRIEKVLGQGGFGITYLATQDLLDRKVCIKEFFFKEYCERGESTSQVSLGTQNNKEMVERFMAKFVKEARTISLLDHPNIIKIHDIFMENNTAYYVMDYIEGESLAEMVNRRGALPEKEAVAYINRVGDALNYIHQHKINHLDVKPQNVMIRKGDLRVILIDFGLSKQYDEVGSQTSSTPVGISQGYAPMEQYMAGGVSSFSPQTDIYALGATLYKLVTGSTPPLASDILNEGLPKLPASVSTSVAKAIEKAMQPRKVDRPQSVSEFLVLLNVVSIERPKAEKEKIFSSKSEDTEIIMPQQKSVVEEETKIVEEPKLMKQHDNDSKHNSLSSKKYKFIPYLVIMSIVILVIFFWTKSNKNETVYSTIDTLGSKTTAINNDSVPQISLKEKQKTSLYITTSPVGAMVMIDSKQIGKTPIEGLEVESGEHIVEITLDGYEKVHEKVVFSKKPVVLNKTLNAEKKRQISVNKKTYKVNGVSFNMIRVEGGTFQMGTSDDEKRKIELNGGKLYDDEFPVHSVTLSDFLIGETEVTQELWIAVMGYNPSKNKGNKFPVEKVTWDDCMKFIEKLNNLTGEKFRLPTEAEWEYAARGGKKSRGYLFSGSNDINKVGWYIKNSGGKTHPVGTKHPNELGIYDMSGNVWEQCRDFYVKYCTGENLVEGSENKSRVIRGGSFSSNAVNNCRVSIRNVSFTDSSGDGFVVIGLRMAL